MTDNVSVFDKFSGDSRSKQIRTMHEAKGRLERCVERLSRVEDAKRKSGAACGTEVAEVRASLKAVMDFLGAYES